ncbi:hypothetical protein YWS52_24430 [Chitiniphilus shinanonensis]
MEHEFEMLELHVTGWSCLILTMLCALHGAEVAAGVFLIMAIAAMVTQVLKTWTYHRKHKQQIERLKAAFKQADIERKRQQ